MRDWGACTNGFRVSENIWELVVMVIQPCENPKSHSIVYFKRVNFMVYKLYLKFFDFKNYLEGEPGWLSWLGVRLLIFGLGHDPRVVGSNPA